MEIIMSWVSLRTIVENSSKHYGLTDKTRCRIILLPQAEDFFTLAFAIGQHNEDKTTTVLASRQYKTIGSCLKDKELRAPEWSGFVLTPSGRYIVARNSFYVVVIKLRKKYFVCASDLKQFNDFRKYIRRWRRETTKSIEEVELKSPEIIQDLHRRIDIIQSRIKLLNRIYW